MFDLALRRNRTVLLKAMAVVSAAVPYGYWLVAGQGSSGISKVSFSATIAPVLKAHCTSCHSGSSPAASLDLSSFAGVQKGGASGKVVVAGDTDKSLLLQRLLGQGGKPQMPMGFPPLQPDKIVEIRQWIQQGANDEQGGGAKHWAYIKPVMPPIPVEKTTAWCRNPIDNFVLENLNKDGLHPSPEAPKDILLRRVTLDLTGLPPTPKEIDDFLADKRPDAYERAVDRLLSSPHYGERQARPWLDLARYADSDGYEKDLNRSAYLYRDWVINAFNKNEPYDKFTIDQLAGDLLPNHTTEQLVATGFNRNTMMNLEGGVDQAEAHFNVMLDRVNTTATVWLGSTLQCARCHDHKYDPFTQKDYYSMMAFYNNAKIEPQGSALIGEEKWFETFLPVPTQEQSERKIALTKQVAGLKSELSATTPTLDAEYGHWRTALKSPPIWTQLNPVKVTSESGATMQIQKDLSVLATGPIPNQDVYDFIGSIPTKDPSTVTGLQLQVLPDPSLLNNGPGRAGNFVLTKMTVKADGKEVPLAHASADFVQDTYNPQRTLYGDRESGWALYGALGKAHSMVVSFVRPVSASKVEVTLEHNSKWDRHVIGKFKIYVTNSDAPEGELLPASIKTIATNPSPSKEDEKRLLDYYRQISPITAELQRRLSDSERQLEDLNGIPSALVMRDKPADGPLKAQIHNRGEFLSPTTDVVACTPAVFPPMAVQMPRNRLGLAEWLVSPDNPLTARVEVNRLWEKCFGRGIVETSEDFGTQGSPPSNQHLLDWLACTFVKDGWDMKAINRLIVTSATYRQSSDASKELMEKDPLNVFLARGPRFRMEAEMLHDQALAIGGILNLRIGGPSVYPYQPDGVWNTPYNNQGWMEDKNADGYRRGLYTFWKRSSPYPSFMAFDATSREQCTVRRIRTNTPLQALAMLNDKLMFEAAKGLAKRMESHGGDLQAELTFGFEACTARKPAKPELERMLSLVEKLKTTYKDQPEAAAKVGNNPEDAALTLAANVMLNLDETVTKG